MKPKVRAGAISRSVDLEAGELELVVLLADRRRVAQQVADREAVVGLDGEQLARRRRHLVAAVDHQLAARRLLVDDADLLEHLAELQRRAVEHRDLAVHLDQQVGDAARVQRRQQVLDGADGLPLDGERRRVVGVGDAVDVHRHVGVRRQGDDVDAAVGRQRLQRHAGARAGVQAEAVEHGAGAQRALRLAAAASRRSGGGPGARSGGGEAVLAERPAKRPRGAALLARQAPSHRRHTWP